MRSPLLGAAGATLGTLATLGGITFLVSNVAMLAVRTGVKQRRLKVAIPCRPCKGTKMQHCSVCQGKHFLEWSPFQGGVADMLVLCPLCGGYGEQKCFNCMGEGVVVPVRGPCWFVEEYR